MSIIERSNPLNLQYRVCIVAPASSPLGVIVCKTLLKANALVLGVDSKPKHHSLNAGLGTHFQFINCDVIDEGAPEKIIEAAREGFGVERLDVLVNIVGEYWNDQTVGLSRLNEAVARVMEREKRGSIVTVFGEESHSKGSQARQCIDKTEKLVYQDLPQGIRCNTIVSLDSFEDQQSAKPYQDAKAHMVALIKTEKIKKDLPAASGSDQTAKWYEMSNLVLFLAGDMSEGITGSVFRLNGSHRPL